MASINVSGLISGSFDWQTMVDQLIQVDSAPITTLQNEKSTNQKKLDSYSTLESKLYTLQSSVQALSNPTLFSSRTASTSASSWTASAANATATGIHTLSVSRLASAGSRVGAGDIGAPLSSSSDVSGLTLATLPTATAVTAGTFTVDGQTVTVALTDSLQDAFDKISTATGGKVTAGYDSSSDKVTLASSDGSEVVLGAVNDSSNFLQALRLANNSSATVSSSSSLGAASLNVPLASARLNAPITAVDGSGNGTFTINGVSINYNVNTDSLATVLGRINASAAGVTANYDAGSDRVVLTNNSTGDLGLGANEATGGLLDALGLTSGSTLVHGQNALFSVDGGASLSSTSNTLDGSTFGIPGLSVTVDSTTTQTVGVAADSGAMNSAVQSFITAFNDVQSYIDTQTSITIDSTSNSVQAALLAGNHDVQGLADQLHTMAYAQIPGLTGTITRLENLGIDFSSTSSQLSVIDQSKLDDALQNHSADVSAFFATASTGFGAVFNSTLNNVLGPSGQLAVQSNTLTQQDTSIDNQIAALQRQLDQERAMLTNSFEAMQTAQSNADSQIKYLTQMYFSGSSSSSSK